MQGPAQKPGMATYVSARVVGLENIVTSQVVEQSWHLNTVSWWQIGLALIMGDTSLPEVAEKIRKVKENTKLSYYKNSRLCPHKPYIAEN